MSIKCITATVPVDMLPRLEDNLRACGVPGVTVETVRGYGEHPNYFRKDLMQENAKLILYSSSDRVTRIIHAISACARDCGVTSGIIAVHGVDRLVQLKDGGDVPVSALHD